MRDLRSLCDRLDEMFEGDGITPDALSVEAREAIEELWQERDRLSSKLEKLQQEYSEWAASAEIEKLKAERDGYASRLDQFCKLAYDISGQQHRDERYWCVWPDQMRKLDDLRREHRGVCNPASQA